MDTSVVKSLLDFLKDAPRYLIILGIPAALLVFLPESALHAIGLDEFVKENREYIGLALIFSITLGLFYGGEFLWKRSQRRRILGEKKLQLAERRAKRFESLTEEEKKILRYYLIYQTKTNHLRIDDGVVQGLVAAGIIFKSSRLINVMVSPYNITDEAWEYINAHSEVLKGYTNKARFDDPDRIWPTI